MLYLAVLAFSFLSVALYQRIARLESNITQLTRELALRTPPHGTAEPVPAPGHVSRPVVVGPAMAADSSGFGHGQ